MWSCANKRERYLGSVEGRGNADTSGRGEGAKEAEEEGLGAFTGSSYNSTETVSALVKSLYCNRTCILWKF